MFNVKFETINFISWNNVSKRDIYMFNVYLYLYILNIFDAETDCVVDYD